MFVSREATILHADLDSFFASVEQRDDPRLLGRPVIVGGGVVLAASYEAKAFGVRTAMSERRARALCRHAVVVRPRFSAYVEASKAVFEVFDDTSPRVEGLSIDEAFLDVRGMERAFGTPVEIAERLRRNVREPRWAADHRRRGPDEVPGQGRERRREAGRAARGAAGPGARVPAPAAGGAALGRRAGDRGQAPLARDRQGATDRAPARAAARGDARPGRRSAPARLGAQSRPAARADGAAPGLDRLAASAVGAAALEDVDADVVALVDRVTRRMRKAGRVGRTVVLRLRFDDFTRATRSHTLPQPTAHTETVLAVARGLLAAATPLIEQRGLTLVGVAVANLANDDELQLPLPFHPRDELLLDEAVDDVRDRYGSSAVTRALLLGRDAGYTMPMLPD